MKRIKVGNKYLIQEDDGCIRPETREDKISYDYLTTSYKESYKRINKTEVKKVKRNRNIYTEIDTKNRSRSFAPLKVIMSKETLAYLDKNNEIKELVFKKYGLYTVDIIMDSDISFGYFKIYYDDNRIEIVEIGGCYKKKPHYAETLMEELKNNHKCNKK